MTDLAASSEPVVALTARLDVVVLGGAGHVGLPLSLAFADAGLRVGIFDINAPPRADRRGEMPFMETGAEALLAKVLATGRLELTTRPMSSAAPTS